MQQYFIKIEGIFEFFKFFWNFFFSDQILIGGGWDEPKLKEIHSLITHRVMKIEFFSSSYHQI